MKTSLTLITACNVRPQVINVLEFIINCHPFLEWALGSKFPYLENSLSSSNEGQ